MRIKGAGPRQRHLISKHHSIRNWYRRKVGSAEALQDAICHQQAAALVAGVCLLRATIHVPHGGHFPIC